MSILAVSTNVTKGNDEISSQAGGIIEQICLQTANIFLITGQL